MDVARINFSHFDGSEPGKVRELVERIRTAGREAGRPVTVIGDLAGPKMRVVNVEKTLSVSPGDILHLVDQGEEAISELVLEVKSEGLDLDAAVGERVFLADGLVRGEVIRQGGDGIAVQITGGGEVKDGKGVHLPDGGSVGGAITSYDGQCIEAGLQAGIDWFAVSFVTSGDDVREVKMRVGDKAAVLAKIERAAAVDDIEDILSCADGIMVARGDLGVELPPEAVPAAQKDLIARAIDAGVPAVVATEMLESMIHNDRATRAEVSDVANAVLDGAAAVMLSAETAIGVNPISSVATMDRVLKEIENYRTFNSILRSQRSEHLDNEGLGWAGTLAAAAVAAGEMVEAETIIVVTETGNTAKKLAASRPPMAVVACCHRRDVAQRLGMYWGVTAVTIPRYPTRHELRDGAVRAASEALGLDGGVVVVLSGEPDRSGGIDNLRIVGLVGER